MQQLPMENGLGMVPLTAPSISIADRYSMMMQNKYGQTGSGAIEETCKDFH